MNHTNMIKVYVTKTQAYKYLHKSMQYNRSIILIILKVFSLSLLLGFGDIGTLQSINWFTSQSCTDPSPGQKHLFQS